MIKWLLTLCSIAWTSAVIVGSLMSPSSLAQFTWDSVMTADKLLHLTAYFVMCPLVLLAIAAWLDRSPSLFIQVFCIVSCIGLGLLIEFLQGNMGVGRQLDWADAIANSVGACCGFGCVVLILHLTRRSWTLQAHNSYSAR